MTEELWDGRTRRRFVRIPTIVPVDYQILDDNLLPVDTEIRTGFTRDLSGGGLCLRVTRMASLINNELGQERKPSRISVDLRVPNRPLRVLGRIAWLKSNTENDQGPGIMGIEFDELKEVDREAIELFARRAAAKPKWMKVTFVSLAIVAVLAFAMFLIGQRQQQVLQEQSNLIVQEKQTELENLAAELERLQNDIRELTAEVETLAGKVKSKPSHSGDGAGTEMVQTNPGTEGVEPSLVRPAVQSLAEQVASLRAALNHDSKSAVPEKTETPEKSNQP